MPHRLALRGRPHQLYVYSGRSVLITNLRGEVRGAGSEGFHVDNTRVLSEDCLTVDDRPLDLNRWRAAVARFELLTGGARADWGETQELVASREEVTRHADRINQYLQELEAIGCVFKGFEAGLVDFYSLRDDRPIFLCWRLGEERIEHWHEIDTGFSGRQPIDGAILSAMSS